MEKVISKMMITIIVFIIVLGMLGGEFFALLAGVIYDMTRYLNETWGWTKVFCRMMTNLAVFRTCKHPKHPQSRKSSPRCYRRGTQRSRKMTSRPSSTVAWKTLWKGGRLRMALCFTSLPIIINAKASSLVDAFPEGVHFDTNSFPIAIDSGSTYCLSDRRSDFEGDLIKVNVKYKAYWSQRAYLNGKGQSDGKYKTIKVKNMCSQYQTLYSWRHHYRSAYSHHNIWHKSIEGANWTL
jgi:hypothetical protein